MITSNQITYLIFSIVILITLIYVTIFYVMVFNFFRRKVYTKPYSKWALGLMLYVYDLFILIIAICTTFLGGDIYFIVIIWIEIGLAILLTIILTLLSLKVKKDKKQIINFREEDFQGMLYQLEQNKPSQSYIERYIKRHKFYISQMEQKKVIIDTMMECYQDQDYERILLKIILFNDQFTSRWTNKTNYFQMKFFLEFCINLQEKAQK